MNSQEKEIKVQISRHLKSSSSRQKWPSTGRFELLALNVTTLYLETNMCVCCEKAERSRMKYKGHIKGIGYHFTNVYANLHSESIPSTAGIYTNKYAHAIL